MRRILLTTVAVALVTSTGCRHWCGKRPLRDRLPALGRDAGPPQTFMADPAPTTRIPAGEFPTNPLTDDSGLPPPSLDERKYTPAPVPNRILPPEPKGEPRLLLPDPLPGSPSSRSAPQAAEKLPPKTTAEKPANIASISGFTTVAPGLSAGNRPGVDGFDALRDRGFRTVVYLHAPGADVSAVRDVAERKNLAFSPVAVSPDTLATGYGRFAAVIGDPANRPAFVFADLPGRAGGVWYTYFRKAEQLPDDAARVRAANLGLRDSPDAEGYIKAADGVK